MAACPLLAGIAVGDYVTIINAYDRKVRGRVVQVYRDGHCAIEAGELMLLADEWNTVHVEHLPEPEFAMQ